MERLTDVTSRDRLGLPVCFCIRRRGLTRRVHAGKGENSIDAYVGAAMEAIEFAVAESASAAGADAALPADQLVAQLPDRLRLSDFAPRLGATPSPTALIASARCEDIASGETTFLPAELVFVPAPKSEGPPLFGWSTNGLASGNTLQEATLHAILEVIERDSVAINLARDQSCLLPHSNLPDPFKGHAVGWQRQGIELIVRCIPNEFELPCFEAGIYDHANRDVPLACGWGLHLERGLALSRAVCEAAQARLVALHGSRFYRGKIELGQNGVTRQERVEGNKSVLARLTNNARRIDFSSIPDHPCRSVKSALTHVMTRLAGCGMKRVFRRRMLLSAKHGELLGLHVVKVVIPRCESLIDSHVRMGPRLLSQVLGQR